MNEEENGIFGSDVSQDQWNILRDVYKMLVDAHILNTPPSVLIVDFKFPDELMVRI